MVENSAVVRDGDKAYVWRVKDGILSKVAIQLGERDQRRGDFAVRAGLNNGDQVIRNPLSTLKDGKKAQLVASAMPPKAVSAPVAASSAAGK
jgi:hypothetical protein